MWISLKQASRLAGINPRSLRRAAGRATSETFEWRGAQVEIRKVRGRGGAAGIAYEVRAESLPMDLQRALSQQGPGPTAEVVGWTTTEREARHAAFAKLPSSIQESAKRRLAAVQHYNLVSKAELPETERLRAAAAYAGKSMSAFRRWLAMCNGVHPGDWVVALAPRHAGNRISAPMTHEAYEFIKAEYFTLTKPALKPIYRRAKKLAQEQGWALPSYSAVKRRIRSEPAWMHTALREGGEALERMYPTQEREYGALKLHEMWCADGRKADVFVRWDDGTISRPIVVGWMDLRSRVIVGYDVGKTESADLIRRSFRLAAQSAHALPESVYFDNGRGFASLQLCGGVPHRFRNPVDGEEIPGVFPLLGIRVTFAQPGRGRSKPIERAWRHLAEMDKQFPGAYCGNKPDARPEDFDIDRAIPVARYRAALEATLRIYHESAHRGDAMHGRSPADVYKELLGQTAVRQPTTEQLRICLQAAESIVVARGEKSIRVLGNRYWNEDLANLWPGQKLVVRFDPEDASVPVCVYDGERFICEAAMIERTGFRDRQAAKDHSRANRAFRKAKAEQAAALRGMGDSLRWMKPEQSAAASSAAQLPDPKVVTPIRPRVKYETPAASAAAARSVADVSTDEFQAALMRASTKKRRTR